MILEYVAKVRNLAIEKKTTVKRALDILEISLPIFIMANDLSKDDERLSDEVAILQEEYEDTKKEIIRCQEEFEMEKRKETLKHGKALLSGYSLHMQMILHDTMTSSLQEVYFFRMNGSV